MTDDLIFIQISSMLPLILAHYDGKSNTERKCSISNLTNKLLQN